MIELLIVVVMIVILAAIAVPNFLEAHIRSKIAHTVQSQQFIAVAMESYFADNGKYPEVPPLIKSKKQPVCEEIIALSDAHRRDGFGMNPFHTGKNPPRAEPVFMNPPTPSKGVPEPVGKKVKYMELETGEKISESEAKQLQEKIKKIESWAGYFCFPEEVWQCRIITPETVISEYSNIDVSEENKQSLLNRPDELLRLSVFAYQEDIYKAAEIPDYVNKVKVTNQNIASNALYSLTTPVAYIAEEYLKDKFLGRITRPYCYLNFTQIHSKGIRIEKTGQTMLYVIISAGPDTEIDFVNTIQPIYEIYDPTNGTISKGDLLRWSEALNK